MRIFTGRQWRRHLADQREALAAARNNKPTDYQREQLTRYRSVIRELWDKHSKFSPNGEPGDSGFGQTWWCSECRTPWPCRTVRAVFAAEGFEYEYAPLRLSIRGEKRVKDGIELGVGHWMHVQGVEPDRCPNCEPPAADPPLACWEKQLVTEPFEQFTCSLPTGHDGPCVR